MHVQIMLMARFFYLIKKQKTILMKKYMIILLIITSILNGDRVFSQTSAKHHKIVNRGTPCNTMVTRPKHYGKSLAKHHPVKRHPIKRVEETITIDDHSATAIVNIKNGNVYVNDSLVTKIRNPKNEDHRIIINYITPPPQPTVTEIEHVKINAYTAERPAKGMLGVRVSDECMAGAMIQDIIPCSAAEKNGLFPGELITKINDHQINNADELLDVLGTYNNGDNVTVTYDDFGRTETMKVELGPIQNGMSCAHSEMRPCGCHHFYSMR